MFSDSETDCKWRYRGETGVPGGKSVRMPLCDPDTTCAELGLNRGMCVETRRLTVVYEARRGVGTVQILAFTEENSSDLDIVGSGLPPGLCMKHVDSVTNRKPVSLQLSFPGGRCLLCVRFVTILKSILQTALTKQNTKE